MTDRRSPNEKAFDAFRDRLTKGFYIVDNDTDSVVEDPDALDKALRATKAWRNELWQAFSKLERDVCPMVRLRYERQQKAK